MSTQSMVTIAAPIALADVAMLRRLIGEELKNPAGDAFRQAVEQPHDPFLHFASLHALEGSDGQGGHLVLEFSADGDERFIIAELARRAGALLLPIFRKASDWSEGQEIGAYWMSHRISVGHGLLSNPGLAFCGTPGLTVADIHREQALSHEIVLLLSQRDVTEPPLGKIAGVRKSLASMGFGWALEPALPPPVAPDKEPGAVAKLIVLAPSFVTTFLWPLLLALLPLCLWLAWPAEWLWSQPRAAESSGIFWWFAVLRQMAGFVAATVGLMVSCTLVILSFAYLVFARQERRDFVSDRAPRAEEAKEMVAHENADAHVQNHMMSHTVLKPGILRMLTIRLAFWAITKLTVLNPRVGYLGDIGTIHFARWVMIPGTRDLLFFSNYGGSWESYLEDFITKAHTGLTAVWSNTVGFPRSRNLFQDGATDGERFKRYARQSMIHTPFWYCAYRDLTTADIRRNQLVRRGISAAMTEGEAIEWLTLFGSAPRPIGKLETTQIQSLVFGGLGFKPAGRLVVIDLGDDIDRNRRWLGTILPFVAFNDGRYDTRSALLTFAVSAQGLAKLGLDEETRATFPVAFLQGMHGPGRERILGDIGTNAREHWLWGRDGNDVAILVYGDDKSDVAALAKQLRTLTKAEGGTITFQQDLTPVDKKLSNRREPFGFVDGISQPAIRGTYRGLRNDDPIHLVEPGEFVLGYPDNRDNLPPGPTMAARHDPGLHLPVAGSSHGFAEMTAENPRLVGHNGSFLVIRQLHQDVVKFENYCQAEGAKLEAAFPDLPLLVDKEDMTAFVGAKMIGRWQDGSSLVRFPYLSASRLEEVTSRHVTAAASRPQSDPAGAAAPPIAPADVRGETRSAKSKLDNDYLFGTEDPQGLRCPYGAHVRRANPRDSLDPGSNDQIAISNRHRILRVGRGYLDTKTKTTAGLMFMCLNGDIERQFEFIQQTWMGSTKFHGLSAEADPIAGRGLADGDGFTIPSRRGPVSLDRLPQFVTVKGGGYFFLPGRQLLSYLAVG